jgi:hypothetical protein
MYSSLSATSGIMENHMYASRYELAATGRQKIIDKQSTHWKKYLTLRAVGWSAFGVGIGVTCFGFIGAAAESVNGHGNNIWALPFYGGLTMLAGSIPTLFCAYHQRHKATYYTVGCQGIPVTLPTGNMSNMPALSLSIHF